MAVDRSPTVRRRRLGMELRNLRESAGLTIDEVASHLECSSSKVSRLETGKGVPRQRDVRDMLDLYGVVEQTQRELMIKITREAQSKGWWTDYEDVLPAAFETYIGLEEDAATLRTFQHHVHGLLQTEDYARASLRAALIADTSESVDRRVRLRIDRQRQLTKDDPVELWAVIDEAALHRSVGGAKVMHGQLHHLIDASEMPNITLQVLPFSQGAHPGLVGAFALIEFPDVNDHDVVYVDSPAGNIYLEKPSDIRRYTLIFDHLRAAALAPDQSVELIEELATRLH
jgi:transcriptional regulator with XRE-family HTH domain